MTAAVAQSQIFLFRALMETRTGREGQRFPWPWCLGLFAPLQKYTEWVTS